MPREPLLDPVIHQPLRLALLGMLRPVAQVEFRLLRDELGISDSSLSQHLTALDKAGLITIKKGALGRRPRTWVALSPAGHRALSAYLEQIRNLAGNP